MALASRQAFNSRRRVEAAERRRGQGSRRRLRIRLAHRRSCAPAAQAGADPGVCRVSDWLSVVPPSPLACLRSGGDRSGAWSGIDAEVTEATICVSRSLRLARIPSSSRRLTRCPLIEPPSRRIKNSTTEVGEESYPLHRREGEFAAASLSAPRRDTTVGTTLALIPKCAHDRLRERRPTGSRVLCKSLPHSSDRWRLKHLGFNLIGWYAEGLRTGRLELGRVRDRG